jgi:GntR family transcriptional regulator
MELHRESKVPLYQQIKGAIRLHIEAGDWKPGQQIPSEPELSVALGVARGTVRNAITELVHEGWLERRQGDGTYVTRRSLEQRLMGFYSFAREARERGQELISRVLEWLTTPCSEGLSRRLERPVGDPVLRVTRLRLLEGEPIILETCLLPMDVAAPLREEDFAHGALYDALEERCGIHVLSAEETFWAIGLGAYEAELLRMAPGAPALSVERVAYTLGERPVELRLGTLRGDRCRYRIDLETRR